MGEPKEDKSFFSNEIRFQKLIEDADALMCLVDENLKIIYTSSALERMLGFTPEEVNGFEQFAIVHPDNKLDSKKSHEFIIANLGVPLKHNKRIMHKKGHYVWVEGTITNYLNEQNIKAIVAVYRDVSEHKQIEEKLIKSENRFRALIENSTDMKALTSKYGRLIYSSPSVATTLGYTQKELMRIGLVNLIHKDDAELVLTNTLDILQNPGASFFGKLRILHKDGTWLWCEGTVTNLLHEPNIAALVSNFRDITERKKSESQREFDRTNLRALINNTQDLIWSVNTNYKLITSNIHFDKIVGKISGQVIKKGRDVLAWGFTPEQLEQWKGYYDRAFTGESFTVITKTEKPVERCSEISFYPIYKDAIVIGTACFSRDILSKIKAEEKLNKQYLTLKEIAFMLSHQARAPIASVLGLISLFNFDDLADPINIEVLQNIQKTTKLFDTAIHEIVKSTSELNKLEN